MGLFGLVPLVIIVWLIVRVVQTGARQEHLDHRIQAPERAGNPNR